MTSPLITSTRGRHRPAKTTAASAATKSAISPERDTVSTMPASESAAAPKATLRRAGERREIRASPVASAVLATSTAASSFALSEPLEIRAASPYGVGPDPVSTPTIVASDAPMMNAQKTLITSRSVLMAVKTIRKRIAFSARRDRASNAAAGCSDQAKLNPFQARKISSTPLILG